MVFDVAEGGLEEAAFFACGAEGLWFGGAEVGAGFFEGGDGVDVDGEAGVFKEGGDGIAEVVVGGVEEGAEGGGAGGEGLCRRSRCGCGRW